MKYKITMTSKDNHVFVFKTIAYSEAEAIKNAKDNLEKNMYSHYSYKVTKVEQN